MAGTKLDEIKERLSEVETGQYKMDLVWLIERVEKLEAEKERLMGENEFLRSELNQMSSSCQM